MMMSKRMPLERTRRAKNARQSLLLLLLGVICLLLAWLLHPRAPLGILVFGVGMMIAAVYNPYRLMAAAWITTTIGVPVFLFFGHYIPGNEVFPAYIIALGVGLLGIAMMGRRGYIGRGAVTPGILVLGIGVLEALLVANLTPANLVPFALSLWLPGIGLLMVGLFYLVMSLFS